jgi:RES domain-containing protein
VSEKGVSELLSVAGRFWRAVPEDRVAQVLDPPGPESAGRYHRPGEPALYITREADWATIALGRYMAVDGIPRLAIPLELDSAKLLDQRDAGACAALGFDPARSQARWQDVLAAGGEPPSWHASDVARASGADGLVDPSRGIDGGWHVVLFHWNTPGAPQLRVCGDPVPCDYAAARGRWAAPEGWELPEGFRPR